MLRRTFLVPCVEYVLKLYFSMETSVFVRIYFSRYFFSFYVRARGSSGYNYKFAGSHSYFSDRYVYKPITSSVTAFNSRTFVIPLKFFFFNTYYDYSYKNCVQNSKILHTILIFILKLRIMDLTCKKSIRYNYILYLIINDNHLLSTGKRR